MIGKRITYQVAANWKLIIENFMECYHCATIHPELTGVLPEFARRYAAQYCVGHGAAFAGQAEAFTVTGSGGFGRLPGLSPEQGRKDGRHRRPRPGPAREATDHRAPAGTRAEAGVRTHGPGVPTPPTSRRFPGQPAQCSMTAVVPAHRCGAVPDSHRVPSYDAPGHSLGANRPHQQCKHLMPAFP